MGLQELLNVILFNFYKKKIKRGGKAGGGVGVGGMFITIREQSYTAFFL